MEIVILLIAFVVSYYIAFSVGKNSVQQQEALNNEKVLLERQSIEKEIEYKRQESARIESEYQSKLKIIEDAENAAATAHQLKAKQLQDDYENKRVQLALEFSNQKKTADLEIEILKRELDSLKTTRAAIIEAAQQEEKLQADKDFFRLNVSDQDVRDINVLNTIKPQISKPRLLSMLIWQTYYQPIAKQKFPLLLGSKDVCGIYKITNLINQKCYIGQAVNVRERWNQHAKCGLDIDTPQGNKLYQAMLKDGLENFSFQLLEECPRDELNKKENYYINMYNSCEFGYNSNTGIKDGN
jgi:hypothetical protein